MIITVIPKYHPAFKDISWISLHKLSICFYLTYRILVL